ncbi:MAG: M20/M25/M40 family metallo-hydrolase [Chloroflexi bacterium]|nr:MAG: M20/M25/M40 family metallo-hydrolase [Chloroflexota bacterium]TMF77963.1 MAG: M20/M25/M40 family metallo-hydrolase [Chloroflexota bacterium]TMF91159.1 MAG: M20/M25/M40 family metallo-hydrolase [Chloroflexota bacterium]TMG45556.1 MAG: M20/M25/M40 family metallo-hydrolase [Chloroflexota bacterium]
MISTSAVDAYVEKHSRRFIDDLKELCSFPSISNHGRDAVQPAREWLAVRLAKFTDRVETLEAGGMPALYAEVSGGGRRKLLLYEHYDVQPVDPIDLWSTPPFEPAERDGRIFARGVADDKADVMARIHALETLKQLGDVPVTLRFLIEGEEEIGSKTFERIAREHAAKLRADGCLWESGTSFDDAGRPTLQFGCRGLVYVTLRVKQLDYDQHSGFASIYPSAAMYLVGALASLRDQDMNIKIDGFYDKVVKPTEADRRMMATIDPEVEKRRKLVGFEKLVREPKPDQVIEQMLFLPTCNIAGIMTGYQGPGSKTVLPAEATAKLDFRLIPNQDPDEVLEQLRAHLDRHGFEKVEIVAGEGEKPARSDPSSPVAKTVIDCVREMYGEPVLWPFMPATGPMYPVVSDLGIPTVLPVGVGRPDNRIHAPNENIRTEDYLNTVRLMCRIWERFGAS